MAALYIDRRGTALTVERAALTIREPGARPRTVPLHMIERLVLVGDVRVSAAVLTRLAALDCSVSCLPGRGRSGGVHLSGMSHGDVGRRIAQYRLSVDPAARAVWVRQLIHLRLAGQRRLLGMGLRSQPAERLALHRAMHQVRAAMQALRDPQLRVEQMRGHEGAATQAFFAGYRVMLPLAAGFDGRNRRPPRDPVNAALSLGYTLSHGDALRAIQRAGLDPTLGLLHEPHHGRDSLACDLNELARSRIEWLVWRLFAEQTLRSDDFHPQPDGAVWLGKAGRERFYACYEQHAGTHRRWLQQAAGFLARTLSAGEEALND